MRVTKRLMVASLLAGSLLLQPVVSVYTAPPAAALLEPLLKVTDSLTRKRESTSGSTAKTTPSSKPTTNKRSLLGGVKELVLPKRLTVNKFSTFSMDTAKGIHVGFSFDNFSVIKSVKVELYQDDRLLVTNTATAELRKQMTAGKSKALTSFYTKNARPSSYWQQGDMTWGLHDKPTKAAVRIVDTTGQKNVAAYTLSEADGAVWEDIVADEVAPSVPTGGTPDGTEQLTVDVPLTWDLSTDDSGEAVTYEVQYGKEEKFGDNLELVETQEPTTTITDLTDGEWFWRVRAIDSSGNRSVFSDIWSFAVSAGNSAPVTSKPDAGFTPTSQDVGFLKKVDPVPLFFAPTTLVNPESTVKLVPADTVKDVPALIAQTVGGAVPQVNDTFTEGEGVFHASPKGWQLFGLAWYWWLVGGAGVSVAARQLWIKHQIG